MISILDKEIITAEDLKSIIELEIEESIFLDFKSSESLGLTDKKKSEIAKDVSAFANSAGGYIIYGISESNHKASSFSPIDGSTLTKEWLEQVIQTRIQRKIDSLRIIPVRIKNDIKKTVYIVRIPESNLAPHMTSDKKFYKRYNFESVQMEEYEIRNLYNRKEKTILKINNIITNRNIEYEETENGINVCKKLFFQIQNISKAVEKHYKLVIEINFTEYTFKYDTTTLTNNFNHSLKNNNTGIISFNGVSPIFPDEILTIGQVDFCIDKSKLNEILKKGTFLLKLLYSNGSEEMKIKVKDFFRQT